MYPVVWCSYWLPRWGWNALRDGDSLVGEPDRKTRFATRSARRLLAAGHQGRSREPGGERCRLQPAAICGKTRRCGARAAGRSAGEADRASTARQKPALLTPIILLQGRDTQVFNTC